MAKIEAFEAFKLTNKLNISKDFPPKHIFVHNHRSQHHKVLQLWHELGDSCENASVDILRF